MKPEPENETASRILGAEPSARTGSPSTAGPVSRGRPSLMSSAAVLERIHQLATRREGLFRVHHTHPDLYARARRQFGSWALAVRAAGVDYDTFLASARRRSIQARRRRRTRPGVATPP